jgi:acetyl esterase/lipase
LLLGVAAMASMAFTPADGLNLLVSTDGFERSTVSYAEGARHSLDVYRPRNAVNAPVVIFFYGGNWQSGDKDTYLFLAAALADRGFVVIVPDYRIYPQARFPDFLQDGAQAAAWAKANAARYGGDPAALFLMGHSAGAYIAAMLSFDAQWLAAVHLDPRRDLAGLIGVAGPYDFLPLTDPILKVIFGGAERPETQPISFAKGGEAPSLLVAPTQDDTVDPGNVTRLAARLRAVGSAVTTHSYERAGHISIVGAFAPLLRFFAPVANDVDVFIRDVVRRRVRADVTPESAAPKSAAPQNAQP